MSELRRKDLVALLDLSVAVRTMFDTEHFGPAVLGALRRLVPADSITYNEIDTRRHHVVFAVDPPDALSNADGAAFERYVGQHPVVAYSRQTGDGRAHKISDFMDRSQFHHTDLYATYFRPANVEYQIAITLSHGRSFVVGVALNRSDRDFSARDRALLDAARTELVACYRAMTVARETAALLAAADRALEDQHRGVVVVRSDGRLVAATPTAQRLLATHRGIRADTGQRLPARLATLARTSAPPPVALAGQNARLYARVLPAPDPDQRVIVIDERPVNTHEPLYAAGLTHREEQVLALIGAGRTNTEIAVDLGVSVRTVHKHLEHMYPKLGVHDRTAAATRWLDERGPARSIEAVP